MKTAELSSGRLAELIEKFSSCRIAVLGDFFLDKYLDIEPDLEEHSIETGRAAHQVVDIRTSPGAAGTVMCNLASLQVGQLHAIGFTGDDGESYDLRKGLHKLQCKTDHLHTVPDRRTPTYLKPRNIRDASLAGEQDRYDTKNRVETSPATEQKIIQSVDALLPHVDALVIMDQIEERNCGAVTDHIRNALAERAPCYPGVFFWADSRRRIREFQNVLIKANQFEVIGLEWSNPNAEVDLEELRIAVKKLRERTRAPIVATRGPKGMMVSDPEWTCVPGVKVDGETDPTGAGDSASAGAVLALCAGASLAEAAVVANLVASITVQQLATTGVARPDQLPGRLSLWRAQQLA